MDWLVFAFALELGAIRGPDILPDSPGEFAGYVQTEVALTMFGHVTFGGTMRAYELWAEGYQFSPFRMDYTTGIAATFGVLSFGVEHVCSHPVTTPWEGSPSGIESGGTERAFVRIATPRTTP